MRVAFILLGGAIALPWACKPSQTDAPQDAAAGSFTYPKDPPVVDLDGLKRLIAEHRGSIVLLDFWSTSCPPCVKGFPCLAELARKYGPAGLRILAVNLDRPEEWEKAVAILEAKKANFPCAILKDGAADPTLERLSARWRGELPARFLFGRDGAMAKELLFEATEEDVEAAVRKLLAASEGGGPARQAQPASSEKGQP